MGKDPPDTLAGYLTKVSKGGAGKSVLKLVRFCPSALTIQWAGRNEAKGERVLALSLAPAELKKDFSDAEIALCFVLETTLKKLVLMASSKHEFQLWTDCVSKALEKSKK